MPITALPLAMTATSSTGEEQGLSQATVWHPVVPGDTWEGVCKQRGHVYVSHMGLGWLNLQTAVGRQQLQEASPNALLHLFPK